MNPEHVQQITCDNCHFAMMHDGSLAGRVIDCPGCGAPLKFPGELAPSDTVENKEKNFEYEIHGQHPVQAEGTVAGHDFYFRAKWDFWDFTLSVTPPGSDASSLTPPDDINGFFQDGDNKGFHLGEAYGTDQDAGKMDLKIAHELIENCIDKFLSEKPEQVAE